MTTDKKIRIIVEREADLINVYANTEDIDIDVLDHDLWCEESPDEGMTDFYEMLEDETEELIEVY